MYNRSHSRLIGPNVKRSTRIASGGMTLDAFEGMIFPGREAGCVISSVSTSATRADGAAAMCRRKTSPVLTAQSRIGWKRSPTRSGRSLFHRAWIACCPQLDYSFEFSSARESPASDFGFFLD